MGFSGFGLTYTYNSVGYLTTVKDSVSNLAYWTANAYDAEGHLTQATFGNGIQTNTTHASSHFVARDALQLVGDLTLCVP